MKLALIIALLMLLASWRDSEKLLPLLVGVALGGAVVWRWR